MKCVGIKLNVSKTLSDVAIKLFSLVSLVKVRNVCFLLCLHSINIIDINVT